MKRTFLDRYAIAILVVSLILLPIVLVGAVRSLKVHANDIRQWLPKGFEAAETYDWFTSQFGGDEMIVMSWDDAVIDSKEVYRFQLALQEVEFERQKVFFKVTSGPQLLQDIRDLGVSEATARRRLEGLAIGPDGKTTCILAFPYKEISQKRKEIVGLVYQLAESDFGIEASELKIGGPIADGAAVDMESKRSLDTYMWYTVLTVFLLAWLRMGDFRMAMTVMGFSLLCAGISLSVLHWTGGKMNLTMIMLPTLTFILGVSGCVHMANYYRSALQAGGPIPPAAQAMRDGGVPVAMAAITTAIGMASLATSQVTPIREFGLYSAMGVICSMPVILLLMPAVMHLFFRRQPKQQTKRIPTKREQKTGVSRSTSLVINWVCRFHWWVTIPSLIGLVALAIGGTRLKASVKIQNRFADRTTIIQNYQWLESKLGPLVPMEVVLRFEKTDDYTLWQQLELVKSIERALEQTTDINATYSAVTFRPTVPRGKGLRSLMQKRLIVNEWLENISQLEDAHLLRRNEDETLWRISARVAALNDIDYGDFLQTIQVNVDQQISHLQDRLAKDPRISAVITGTIPLVYQAQHQILKDLSISFLAAFFFITIVLIYVLKSFRAGLIAMLPNVFPPIVVFGGMGWLGIPIEIGSVMTASVALGIAVDDTIHFLTWYRRGFKIGKSRFKSIQYAFNHCAKAMIDTTLICGLGVAPFLFSDFMPTVRFSRLMVILLTTALVGDLILLPAILAGPSGLLFRRAKKLFGRNRKEPARPRRKKTATTKQK